MFNVQNSGTLATNALHSLGYLSRLLNLSCPLLTSHPLSLLTSLCCWFFVSSSYTLINSITP